MTYNLDVFSLDKRVFSGLVTNISVVGSKGELGIYSNHAPLIDIIKPSIVKIMKHTKYEDFVYLSGGIIEILLNNVTILADMAIYTQEISETLILELKHQVKKRMKEFYGDNEMMIESYKFN